MIICRFRSFIVQLVLPDSSPVSSVAIAIQLVYQAIDSEEFDALLLPWLTAEIASISLYLKADRPPPMEHDAEPLCYDFACVGSIVCYRHSRSERIRMPELSLRKPHHFGKSREGSNCLRTIFLDTPMGGSTC